MGNGKGNGATKEGPRSRMRSDLLSSCHVQIGGPTLMLEANVARESSASHAKPSQLLTCGQRIGHIASLVPNREKVVAVIGGVALAAVTSKQTVPDNHRLNTTLTSVMKLSPPAIEKDGTVGGEVPAPDECIGKDAVSDLTLSSLACSSYPLIEYYEIEFGRWSAPDTVYIKDWPTQSATVVDWHSFTLNFHSSDGEIRQSVDEHCSFAEVQSVDVDSNSLLCTVSPPKLPALVCSVGGWNGQRRLASMQLYAEGAKNCSEVSAPLAGPSFLLFPESIPPTSGHSCTVVKGKFYLFGGTTLHGCSNSVHRLQITSSKSDADEMCKDSNEPPGPHLDRLKLMADSASTRENATQALPIPSSGQKKALERTPAPAPRSAHASCCLDDRILLFFGGRRLVLEDPANPSKRYTSNSARSKTKNISGRSSMRSASVAPQDQPPGHFSLEIFNDVIAYDIDTQWWIPVQLSGGSAPCPRYAAAICLLPGLSKEGEGAIKEILVHGGVDAHGNTLSDAWILHRKSSLPPKETHLSISHSISATSQKTEVLHFVWVQLNLTLSPTPMTPCAISNETATELSRAYHTAVVIAHQTRVREVLLVGGYLRGTLPAPCMLRMSILPIHKAEET